MVIECSAISYNKDRCIINIYRPPSGNIELFFLQLSHILTKAFNLFKFVILVGDLNIDALSTSLNFKILVDIFASFNLTSMISEPTRIFTTFTHTTFSAIDYVVSSAPGNTKCTNFETGLSDHHGQLVHISSPYTVDSVIKDKYTPNKYKKINENTINEFKFLLSKMDYSFLSENDIDTAFSNFLEHFTWAYDKVFLKNVIIKDKHTSTVTKKNVIRFSDQVQENLTKLKHMNWLKKRLNDTQLDQKYRNLKRNVTKDIKNEKRNHYRKIIENSQNKPKTIWNIVNKVKGKEIMSNDYKIFHNGDIITNKNDIVDIFGNFLSTTIDKKLDSHFGCNISSQCTVGPSSNVSMFFGPVSEDEVFEVIMNLPNKKSTGLDGIPVDLIKKCSKEISPILTELINKSVVLGKFPSSLKIAAILPILKKGDSSNIENYRPIALLSIFSKIIEKVIAKRIHTFLNKNNLLTHCQHGFRPGYSTETGTIELIQHINDRMDRGEYVVALSFDLTRAFDTVHSKFVSEKMTKLGLRGFINDWLTSYLEDRKMVVKIDDAVSNEYCVNVGTPQGSVLGPLIFLLYINDIVDFISHGKILMYADDVIIALSDMDTSQLYKKIEIVMKQFSIWCAKNRLIVNNSKTVLIEFKNSHRQSQNFSFTFNDEVITSSKSIKFLGTILDTNLTWTEHINYVCNKLNKTFYIICSLKSYLEIEPLINVYYAFAYSAISYNIIGWGQSSDLQRVFVSQKRIIRLILNLPYRTSCREMFKKYAILTVPSIYILKLLSHVYQNKHKFLVHSDHHSYNTRQKNNIYNSKHKHTFYEKSPIFAGCQLFNKLPKKMKEEKTFTKFKTSLKKLLVNQSFYSIKEFVNFINVTKFYMRKLQKDFQKNFKIFLKYHCSCLFHP